MPLQWGSVRPPRPHAQNLSPSSGNLSRKIEVSSGKVHVAFGRDGALHASPPYALQGEYVFIHVLPIYTINSH